MRLRQLAFDVLDILSGWVAIALVPLVTILHLPLVLVPVLLVAQSSLTTQPASAERVEGLARSGELQGEKIDRLVRDMQAVAIDVTQLRGEVRNLDDKVGRINGKQDAGLGDDLGPIVDVLILVFGGALGLKHGRRYLRNRIENGG